MQRITGIAGIVSAFLLSLLLGCAPAGPSIVVDPGGVEVGRADDGSQGADAGPSGEAYTLSPVDAEEFSELGAGARAAAEGSAFYYRISPNLSLNSSDSDSSRALAISSDLLGPGTRLLLYGADGEEIATVEWPAVPEELDVARIERVLHVPEETAVAGLILRPSGERELSDVEAPAATLYPSSSFVGVSLRDATFKTGGGASLAVSRGSPVEWRVEFPEVRTANRMGDERSVGGEHRAGRLEIDYAVREDDADGVDGAEDGPAAEDGEDGADGEAGAESSEADTAGSSAPRDRTARIELSDGEQSRGYQARLDPVGGLVALPAPAIGFQPREVRLESEHQAYDISRVQWHVSTARRSPSAGEPELYPIPADLATILSEYPRRAWRRDDFEIFSWSAYPRVLVFDTADYETQSKLFKRLAFFVEKNGFRGELLSDSELSGRHGWNAHNYRPEGLATFYSQAEREDIELTDEEVSLREILLANGIIRGAEDGYEAGEGGILSISQESYPELRELLVSHEAFHGVFYEEPDFRDGIREIWNALSEEERSYWRRLFEYMTYDPADEYLMINEFQAYVLQQPLEAAQGYLRNHLAERLMRARPAQRGEIEGFLTQYPDTFERSAQEATRLLHRHSALDAGEVRLLLPEDD